jgi:hypothetical protein
LRLNVANSKLLYTGVSVILGISSAQHQLVDKQGFYVLDGHHRLFTMPFRAASVDKSAQTMWQLSFSGLTEDEAQQLRSLSPRQLLDAALHRTENWLSPVGDLVKATAESDVWATGLFDRDHRQAAPSQLSRDGAGRCSPPYVDVQGPGRESGS